MPGLRLTEEQVQRLCGVSATTSASALRALVSAGVLDPIEHGRYRRADVEVAPTAHFTSNGVSRP